MAHAHRSAFVNLVCPDVTNEFRRAEDESLLQREIEQAKRICESQIGRVEGLVDAHYERAKTVTSETTKHLNPLDDDQMTIQSTRKDGQVRTRDVTLADTFNNFERLLNRKRIELDNIIEKFKEVDDEIAMVRRDIYQTEKDQVKKVNDDFHLKLNAFTKRAKADKEKTAADIKQTRKHEEADEAANQRLVAQMYEQLL